MRVSGEMSEHAGFRRLGVMLFTIGAIFAVDSYFHLAVAYKLWPLILTVLAIGFIGIFIRRERRDAHYLAIGVYILCFSGLALACTFSSWTMLATLWPSFIAFLGIAFLSVFLFCRKTRINVLAGLLLVSLAAVLFFVVYDLGARLWWTTFILAGLSVFFSGWVKK
jgi:hypothetical protein